MAVLPTALGLLCVFAAAVVRGYAGFGFALLSVTALSIFAEPRDIVPSIFLLDIVASVPLLASAWRDAHWRSIAWLCLGSVGGTPLGVYALAHAPTAPLTVILALIVLALSVMLARGFALKSLPGAASTTATGFASGVLNGGLGIGGPPVVIFYFGSPAAVKTGRASMIAYFLFTDLLGLACQWRAGLVTRAAVGRSLLYVLPLLGGLWVGHRAFTAVDPVRFRQWVLRLLMVLAAITGVHALLQALR